MSIESDLLGINRNIDRINKGVLPAMKDGLDIGLLETVDWIKTEYSRPVTGKGFTDQTGNLRNSIGQNSQLQFGGVLGAIIAKMPYAPNVEAKAEGRFAYLWPGTIERGDQIVDRIAQAVRAIL